LDSLELLAEEIRACTRCELRENCTQPVIGFGDVGAKYLLIGEAPGKDEDKSGIPFCGSSGRKLDQLLPLAGIHPNDVYITNVCRCMPPKLGTERQHPKKKQIAKCIDFLWREIEIIKPEKIITLGGVPLSLFCKYGVRQTHGTSFFFNVPKYKNTEIISQYHPAASLHSPRLWADILGDWQHLPEKVPSDYIVCPKETLNLTGMPLASLDTETDGAGGLGQWSVAYRDGSGQLTVTPFKGRQHGLDYGLCPVAFHNAKYDLRELAKNGMPIPKNFHCTMIQAYCMDLGKQAPKDDSKNRSGSNMVGGLGLKYLARRHLGMEMIKWEDVQNEPEKVPEYNAKDSVATYLLAEKWLPVLPRHYFDIDQPLLLVLMAMEDRGIMIDPDYLQEYAKELDNRLANFDESVQYLASHTQDLQSYIYGTLEIEPWSFTDTGMPSVDADVLEKIDDPLIKQILEYKTLFKDKGTYVDSYIKKRDFDNRVHAEFKQTSTSTRRLSCANPNLQNVDKVGNMRKLFIVKAGHKMVRLDFHLIEFGALAVLAKDAKLIEAFQHGDVHQESANAMGIDRDTAKHINFLMQNGGTAWGMSSTYGLPLDLCKGYFDTYFKRFPALKRFQDETVAKALKTKEVYGYFGSHHRIDALFAQDWRIRKDGEKEVKTYPMQNLAAEIVKLAMIDLHYKHSAPILAQIHDELLFEVPEKDAMEYGLWLKKYVPKITLVDGIEFPVAVSVGNNWYECCQKEKEI
jgi:uracil-DNA glycosylase family 4